MTAIEERLYTRLTGHSGVAALVSTRIYPVKLPQDPTYPALTYSRINTQRNSAMGADIADVRALFQISAWATTYKGALNLGAQVRDALERYQLAGVIQDIYFLNENDLYDDTEQIFHLALDFEINYLE